jgi:lipoprotein-anchoring transpeptidase ErfK/SrfK
MKNAGLGGWLLAVGLALAGCETAELGPTVSMPPDQAADVAEVSKAKAPEVDPELVAIYAARRDGDLVLPAVDVGAFHRELLRNRVEFATTEAPGSIVIDTKGPFLYFVEPEGMATRYGIAVGREGFGWTGAGTVQRTARWPRWTPPPEMIARDPSLEKWRGGQPGGISNPLGARALYIYFGGRDSGFRIHGTNTPKSIGWAASSGCFRMLNQDVIDLYDRVQKGAKVVVM